MKKKSSRRDSVSSDFETSRIRKKYSEIAVYMAAYQKLIRHCLSCLIYYINQGATSVNAGDVEIQSCKQLVNQSERL